MNCTCGAPLPKKAKGVFLCTCGQTWLSTEWFIRKLIDQQLIQEAKDKRCTT